MMRALSLTVNAHQNNRGKVMQTIIFFIRNDAPLYMETYFPEKVIEAFKSQDIKSFIFPKFLQVQAI